MKYQLTLIKNPSGTFSFVGSVPIELGFTRKSGELLTRNDADYVNKQMMLPARYRDVKERSFISRVAAIMIAKELGYYCDDKTE